MRIVAAVVAVLLALVLGGCGQDRGEAYCEDLTKQRKQLAEMLQSDSPEALFENLDRMRELAKGAPSDLKDEWQTFLDAVEGLDRALREADVTPSEFADGQPPAGVSVAERRSIVDAADQLAGDDVVAAASGIEQQARDVCKINLGI